MARQLIAETAKKQVFRDGGRAIKLFGAAYPKTDVLNEALITARIEAVGGLNVPKILDVGVEEDGRWAITYEFIEGKSLRQLMNENPDRMDEYLKRMIELQSSVHARTCPLLNSLRDKMTRQILDLEELDSDYRYDLLTRLGGMPKHAKLCHGDFCPENIIVCEDGVMYTLDWVHAALGNASADAARTYLLLCLEDQETADTYLDLFCRRTRTDKRYVQDWIPLAAAAQLSRRKPEEKELLERWLDESGCK